MANTTLQSFNVFLTERLTAAAVEIYGFVEKTVIEYQEEAYRAKLESQRLQRLLDLVFKPEIKLHRADSRQIDLPTTTQEVCVQEEQIQKGCIPTEVKDEPVSLPIKEEMTEPWTRPVQTSVHSPCSSVTDSLTQIVTVGEHEEDDMSDNLMQVVTVGEHDEYKASDSITQVSTVGEHVEDQTPSPDEQPFPSIGVAPTYAKKKNTFFCYVCCQPFLKKTELKLHLAAHLTEPSPKTTGKSFICYVCDRVTDTRSQMICHMRAHTGEKPFACPVCGNKYKLKGHMKEHLRTHTGERPYTCYICGRSFNRSSAMRKHARIKHKESMPFRCTECSQCFPHLVVFKQHMKMVHQVTYSV